MSEIFEAVDILGTQLETIVGINKVFREFPRPNEPLNPPSLSLISTSTKIEPRMPTVIKNTVDPDDQNDVTSTFILGEYQLSLQLDLWTEYKKERESFYSKIIDIFDSQIASGRSLGLKLQMANYHDVIASYDLLSYNYQDDSNRSLMGEWRIMFEISAHFPRVEEREFPKMRNVSITENIN